MLSIFKSSPAWAIPLLAAAVATVLFVQTYHPAWQGHLQVDVATHYYQINQYLANQSWTGISFNEYQPGALWFFLLPHALASFQENFDAYKSATIFLNVALLAGHVYFYRRLGSKHAVPLFLILALATGPILFYRFDLLATFLVLIAWASFSRNQLPYAGFFLGLSTAVKLYPIIFAIIPAVKTIRERAWEQLGAYGLAFLIGVAVPTVPYLAFGGSLASLQDSFAGQSIKPVGLESLWGTSLALMSQVFPNRPLTIDGAHGIQGIGVSDAARGFYNWIWVVPTGAILFALLRLYPPKEYTNPLIPALVLAAFILSAKVIATQYLWWLVAWLPLISFRTPTSQRTHVILTAAAALAISQLVYPLGYDEFVAWFRGTSDSSFLFAASVVRNGLLVWLTILLFQELAARHQSKTS